LAQFPALRSDPAPAGKAVREAVQRVNALSPEQQRSLLHEKFPDEEAPVQKAARIGLPPLPNAVRGMTSFRLPPEPSGYMHVGHAMAFTINYLYRLEYDGQLWLRFEDTNPRKVSLKYYAKFRQDIEWLGIRWDHEKNVSDDMEAMYARGRDLVAQGGAYVCSCGPDRAKQLRFDGTPCEHRSATVEKNLRIWEELLSRRHKEGEYVVRFMGDMGNVDYSLRDPSIFRIIGTPHPLTGSRYSLWPTYDFANTIEDEICKITHILRSAEFKKDLQQLIRDALKLHRPEVIQFSRFRFKGTPVQKRLLRPLVEERLVSGWDDPRMPTVEGLRRRGITPRAIRDFTVQVGYTKAEHEYDWSILLSINRKLLDPVSKRLFFVPDPVRLSIEGAPSRTVKLPFHPQADLGHRTVKTAGTFYLPGADLAAMEEGSVFRLMDLYNAKLLSAGSKPRAEYAGDENIPATKKLQWVTDDNSEVKVLVPGALFTDDGKFNEDSLREVQGLAERALQTMNVGDIVQFPRFGFCRIDAPGTAVLTQ
jgi:glutamyl-tRNA synthetase